MTYMDDILFIPVVSEDGRRIMITQQAMPADFQESDDITGDEDVPGTHGKAALSHREGRTTATMLSKDGKTLIIVNDTAGIGSGRVKDLVRGLTPLP